MVIEMLAAERLARAKKAYTTHAVRWPDAASLVRDAAQVNVGDLVLAQVEEIGHHDSLEQPNGRRARLHVGDEIVVCYGNRYAPDQFEAEIPTDLSPCHLAAAGGVASRVLSFHQRMAPATRIAPIGLIGDRAGRTMNLRHYSLEPSGVSVRMPVIAVVGTAMNAGKTTSAGYLVRGLALAGKRVGAAKVTGTGAGGDIWFMTDAGASPVLDFTHAGLPTTYLASITDVERVFKTLVGQLALAGCEVAVLEVADGLNQRETDALLKSECFRGTVDAIVFAAYDAMGAGAGVSWLQRNNLPVKAVSGRLTQSPLAVREAEANTGLPVIPSASLADPAIAIGFCQTRPRPIRQPAGRERVEAMAG